MLFFLTIFMRQLQLSHYVFFGGGPVLRYEWVRVIIDRNERRVSFVDKNMNSLSAFSFEKGDDPENLASAYLRTSAKDFYDRAYDLGVVAGSEDSFLLAGSKQVLELNKDFYKHGGRLVKIKKI